EQNRPNVKKRREAWRSVTPWIAPDRLVFQKKSALPLNSQGSMAAARPANAIHHGHWRTLIFIATHWVDRTLPLG
ncbi:MAG: hypothetical protein ACRBM6_26085, partial [Geminicoccales bacterium]